MRNLSVLIQEFGRAAQSGNNGDGFLLINESKDDQRLALWTKNCSKEEEEKIKAEFQQSWRWIYNIYSGRCLRQELIGIFGEDELDIQCIDECCSSCDQKANKNYNAKEAISRMVQAILDLGKVQSFEDGVKEGILIDWLRGSNKDVFSLPEVQEAMEKTSTYGCGVKCDGEKCSVDWWARLLRQAISLKYVDIQFIIQDVNRLQEYGENIRC